jgi:cation diffusion facilitator CzcD-associated flavoprotein CzcO
VGVKSKYRPSDPSDEQGLTRPSGLQLAAHLKSIGTTTLIVEKNSQIGDIWRNRYEYLSLHLPHWADHFAFFPFPEQWPTYTPAQKLGIFMEWYAHAMELPVWTSSEVIKADQDANGQWTITVNKGGKEIRTLHPKHVVSCNSTHWRQPAQFS